MSKSKDIKKELAQAEARAKEVEALLLEAQQEEATDSMVPALSVAESLPAPPDDTTAGMTAETLSGDAFCLIPTPEPIPVMHADDQVVDSSTVAPEERPDDPSHLAA